MSNEEQELRAHLAAERTAQTARLTRPAILNETPPEGQALPAWQARHEAAEQSYFDAVLKKTTMTPEETSFFESIMKRDLRGALLKHNS